jgi:ferredoxin-nitrite reductase
MVDAYDCFIGGRLGATRRFNELFKGKILARDVDVFIDKLLRVYDSMKQGDETFAEFTDRVKKDVILKAYEALC